MKEKYLLFLISILFFCCEQKENKSRFYIGNEEIIEVNENISVYSLRDSTVNSYQRNKNKLISKNKEHFNYTIQDSILEIFGEKYNLYLEFTNQVFLNELEKCWNLDDKKNDITFCLNEGQFKLFLNSTLYEEGEFLVINDFNKYFIFRNNAAKFFNDSFYVIDILNDSIFRLIDSSTMKEVKFTNSNHIM